MQNSIRFRRQIDEMEYVTLLHFCSCVLALRHVFAGFHFSGFRFYEYEPDAAIKRSVFDIEHMERMQIAIAVPNRSLFLYKH